MADLADAAGAGCSLGIDHRNRLRISTDGRAVLAFPGLVPTDAGTDAGPGDVHAIGVSLDLLLSGRVMLGEEAHRIGLVDQLSEPEELLDAAVAYAEELTANCSPASMAVIKAQVQRGLDQTFAENFEESERLIAESFERPDAAEGVEGQLLTQSSSILLLAVWRSGVRVPLAPQEKRPAKPRPTA